MKTVLISIQPKWCELILSGDKTLEIRKNKPKLIKHLQNICGLQNPQYSVKKLIFQTVKLSESLSAIKLYKKYREIGHHNLNTGNIVNY